SDYFSFFFQAEDGIRDFHVTGVQTCALPILRLGRADFAAGREDDGALWLGDGRQALARFEVADALRPDAAATVARLRELGLRPVLLSGDAAAPVADVAAAVGIDDHAARLSPEDKIGRAHV